MNIELKNIKVSESLSEETTAFSATIYLDGKKVGIVTNHGQGGCNSYHFDDPKVGRKLHEYAKILPPIPAGSEGHPELEMDLDLLLGEQLDKFLEQLDKKKQQAQLTRWCKTQIVYRLKGDTEGVYRTIKLRKGGNPWSKAALAYLQKEHGDQIERIVNRELYGEPTV